MDAFATAHRSAASTFGAIELSKNACAGLLFSDEIKNLESALEKQTNSEHSRRFKSINKIKSN